jgi:hypothetical protein
MSWRWCVTSSYVLIDRESWRPFFNLVFFCGVALVLSIPGARVVRDLTSTSFLSRLPTFFYAYALFMGLLGLGLGAASAEREERGARMLFWLALRVFLGQLLCLPYLVFSRALFPGREGAFVLIFLFATLVSLLCAVLSWLVEQPLRWRSSTGFVAKYVFFLCYNAIPLAGIPLFSPLGAVRLLLEGVTPLQALLAFAVPVALLAILSPLAVRLGGEARV